MEWTFFGVLSVIRCLKLFGWTFVFLRFLAIYPSPGPSITCYLFRSAIRTLLTFLITILLPSSWYSWMPAFCFEDCEMYFFLCWSFSWAIFNGTSTITFFLIFFFLTAFSFKRLIWSLLEPGRLGLLSYLIKSFSSFRENCMLLLSRGTESSSFLESDSSLLNRFMKPSCEFFCLLFALCILDESVAVYLMDICLWA